MLIELDKMAPVDATADDAVQSRWGDFYAPRWTVIVPMGWEQDHTGLGTTHRSIGRFKTEAEAIAFVASK